MSLLSRFTGLNRRASLWLDRLVLPDRLRRDGNRDFKETLVPRFLAPGQRIHDLGGGSNPFLTPADKQCLRADVTGLDISAQELRAAPPGSYDRTVAADLCTYQGDGSADLVICMATMEHVPDADGAMRAIASCLRPGGRACVFAPSRNAVFARLNLILPQGLKERLLFRLFPEKATGHDGFPAHYDRCTPGQLAAIARRHGLMVEEQHLYWISSYFTILMPAFVLWRLWQGLFWLVRRGEAAETFALVLRRQTVSENR